MINTISTLIRGANARAEERMRDLNALPLIEQHIREAEASLKAAKVTLASLVQRRRSEDRMIAGLESQMTDLTTRAQEALEAGAMTLAEEAAEAIARLENEHGTRRTTRLALQERIERLRSTVEAGQRRLVDLRQGATAARAARVEQAAQKRLRQTLRTSTAADEAEALIAQVLQKDDPFEQSQILEEIDAELGSKGVTQRLADAGFGPAQKMTGAAVLDRLKAQAAKKDTKSDQTKKD